VTPGETELRKAHAAWEKATDAYNIGAAQYWELEKAEEELDLQVERHLGTLLAELDRLRAAAVPEDSEAYWKEAMR